MAEKVGIENIKKAVVFGVSIGKKVNGILKDGVKPLEFLELIPELSTIPSIVASAPAIKEEINDYSLEERAEIRDLVKAELEGTVDEEVEEVIENSLDTAASIYKLSQSKAFKRKA